MSALAERLPAQDAEILKLDWLAQYILRNRFLPVPPEERIFVGDGGFLAVGVEFLRWFVELGRLTPQERVLDLGCGIGRMAVPLTQYLEDGSYDGVDIAGPGIAWCNEEIAGRYANFRFHHLDLHHALYNPGGSLATREVRLPFADGSFDFVYACSVVTHLPIDEIAAYAREIRRVLAPGGRCFVTAFMLNRPAREGLRSDNAVLAFDGNSNAAELYLDSESPMAAVAFDEDYLLSRFLAAGLRRRQAPVYGRWSGRATPGPSFQDINILEPEPMPAAGHQQDQ